MTTLFIPSYIKDISVSVSIRSLDGEDHRKCVFESTQYDQDVLKNLQALLAASIDQTQRTDVESIEAGAKSGYC